MNRLKSVVLAGALMAGSYVVVAQPSQAATPTAAAASSAYYFHFDKNPKNPADSRLYLKKSVPGKDKVIRSYRAGSGQGSKDECASFRGWLPNGDYRVLRHERKKNGGKSGINGYAIHVEDKWCKGRKTKRTELFIHSEMLPNGKQGPKKGKDSPYRWDGVIDYYSYGCIKITPSDIRDLFKAADRYGWPKKLKVTN